MKNINIKNNVNKILSELPPGVELLAAAKKRSAGEIEEAVKAGVKIIGHNYVKEARQTKEKVKSEARWHLIGHLQRNKVKKALGLFDMIEALDSYRLAREIDKRCSDKGISMPCLVEINSAGEKNKYGILPRETEEFVMEASNSFRNIKIQGLMTMGPFTDKAAEIRPYFGITREIFEDLKKKENKNFKMTYLSMGMSASYRVAIQEGANIVRIGTDIFGPRNK